jgi:hypothetical protein
MLFALERDRIFSTDHSLASHFMRGAIFFIALCLVASASTLRGAAEQGTRPRNAEIATPGQQSPEIDDGWRRTSQGWQHISTWPQPAMRSVDVHRTGSTLQPLLAFCLIACGVIGGVVLLFVDIDPVEYHAFRLKSRR